MKARFTYRSLYREGRDREKQSVWSATPNSDEVDDLQAIRRKLESVDLRELVGGDAEAEATTFLSREYPEVARVRFEIEPFAVVLDEERGLLYVDIDARLVGLDGEGRELQTMEYDYYAGQVVMGALERAVG